MERLKNAKLNAISIYNELEESRKKYGTLKKAEIHFHTPASYDYQLIKGKQYSELTPEEILDYSYQIGYHTKDQISLLKKLLQEGEFDSQNYVNILVDKNVPYNSFKEYLAYELIAHTLYKENIEMAIISDHNTIDGFTKLSYALNNYFKNRIKPNNLTSKKSIYLYLGVEISCSDHNHVVGVFDNNKILEVQKLLNHIIHSKETGTIETSLSVLEKINETGGIGYIAHINTYIGIGTGLYKKALFNYKHLNILGLTNLSSEAWKSKAEISKKPFEFCYFHESDAHCLEDIGIRNTWIKMNETNFNSLKKAIYHHNFCVYTSPPKTTNKFIKGIVLQPSDKSFLRGSSNEANFKVDFSKDLNCIIGGRGTGKSTILNILDIIFTLEAKNKNILKLISQYTYIFTVFRLEGKDYILRCLPQVNSELDSDHPEFFLSDAFVKNSNKHSDVIMLSSNWIDLFEVQKNNGEIELIELKDNNIILNKMYKKYYSINAIINSIQNNKSGDFIKNILVSSMTQNIFFTELHRLENIPRSIFNSEFKKTLITLQKTLDSFNKEVHIQIERYNDNHKNLMKLIHSPKESYSFEYVDDLIKGLPKDHKIAKTMFTWEDFSDYTYKFSEKYGILVFLSLLFNRKFKEINDLQSIHLFVSNERTFLDVENGIKDISEVTPTTLFNEVLVNLREVRGNIIACLKNYLSLVDDYALHFNVNSKVSTESLPVVFKDIEGLSLGQQVVAVLTFIMSYGKFIGDNSPFIIDQPEDNLDNQYIYRNLVKSLQELKNTRQVIVVTHNSTIVTNADAEQVIVLDAENNKGFLKRSGYLSDTNIMRLILVHLEGGEDAFLRKGISYKSILNNL